MAKPLPIQHSHITSEQKHCMSTNDSKRAISLKQGNESKLFVWIEIDSVILCYSKITLTKKVNHYCLFPINESNLNV